MKIENCPECGGKPIPITELRCCGRHVKNSDNNEAIEHWNCLVRLERMKRTKDAKKIQGAGKNTPPELEGKS